MDLISLSPYLRSEQTNIECMYVKPISTSDTLHFSNHRPALRVWQKIPPLSLVISETGSPEKHLTSNAVTTWQPIIIWISAYCREGEPEIYYQGSPRHYLTCLLFGSTALGNDQPQRSTHWRARYYMGPSFFSSDEQHPMLNLAMDHEYLV